MRSADSYLTRTSQQRTACVEAVNQRGSWSLSCCASPTFLQHRTATPRGEHAICNLAALSTAGCQLIPQQLSSTPLNRLTDISARLNANASHDCAATNFDASGLLGHSLGSQVCSTPLERLTEEQSSRTGIKLYELVEKTSERSIASHVVGPGREVECFPGSLRLGCSAD